MRNVEFDPILARDSKFGWRIENYAHSPADRLSLQIFYSSSNHIYWHLSMWKWENWLIDLRRRSWIPYYFFRNGFDHLAKFWQKLRCADWDGWWLLWSGNWKELPVERLQTRWFRLALLIVNERQVLILQSFALHCTFHILGLKLMKSNRRVVSAPVTRCLSTFCRNVHEN